MQGEIKNGVRRQNSGNRRQPRKLFRWQRKNQLSARGRARHNTWGGVVNCGDFTENFVTYRLGACLAYNINRYGTLNAAREKIDEILKQNYVEKGETIMFCFGEIDIRAHVYKEARKQNKTVDDIIDKILDNYLGYLETLTKDYNVWVWGPAAAQASDKSQEDKYVEFGTEEERNKATLIFNSKLKERGEKIGIKHFSIAKDLIDENLHTRTNFLADSIHLSQRAWLYAIPEFKKAGVDVRFKEKWWRRNVTPNKSNADEDLFRTAQVVKVNFEYDFIENMREHLKVFDTDTAVMNMGKLAAPFDTLKTDANYSFSIKNDMGYEEFLAKNNVPVIFWRSESVELNHSNLYKLNVNLTANPSENEREQTLSEIIKNTGFEKSDNLSLRLDMGGMEYDILWNATSNFLSKFKFINVKLNQLLNMAMSDKIFFCLDKLNATHALVYVRVNEGVRCSFARGKMLPDAIEATYVLRKDYNIYKSKTFFPTELDYGVSAVNLGYWG